MKNVGNHLYIVTNIQVIPFLENGFDVLLLRPSHRDDDPLLVSG